MLISISMLGVICSMIGSSCITTAVDKLDKKQWTPNGVVIAIFIGITLNCFGGYIVGYEKCKKDKVLVLKQELIDKGYAEHSTTNGQFRLK